MAMGPAGPLNIPPQEDAGLVDAGLLEGAAEVSAWRRWPAWIGTTLHTLNQ